MRQPKPIPFESKDKYHDLSIILILKSLVFGGLIIGLIIGYIFFSEYELEIIVISNTYEGNLTILIDDYKDYFGWIDEGGKFIRTFILSSGEHSIELSYGVGFGNTTIVDGYLDKSITFVTF